MAWGNNDYGQCDVPAGLSNVVAIAAGWKHSVALQQNGTVVAWGGNNWGQCNVPTGLTGVIAISAGYSNTAALRSNGTVVVWGSNWAGQCNVPANLNQVQAISVGGAHVLALKNDGTVVSWGYNEFGQTTVPTGLSQVVAIAAGGDHSIAVRSNGSVVAWGRNDFGEINIPAGLSQAMQVVTGERHPIVRRTDGSLVSWGRNDYGQATMPQNIMAIAAAGGAYHTVCITQRPVIAIVASDARAREGDNTDNGVFTIIRRGAMQETVSVNISYSGTATVGQDYVALPESVMIPAGQQQVVLTLTTLDDGVLEGLEQATATIVAGAAYAVGYPASATITLVDNDVPVVSIVASDPIASEGVPYNPGRLTIERSGNTDQSLTVQLAVSGTATAGADYAAIPSTITISAGSSRAEVTVAPLDDGMIEPEETIIVSVLPGGATYQVLDQDLAIILIGLPPGAPIAWGRNHFGQCDVPVGLNDVVSLSCDLHVVAIRANGTLLAWGNNENGQCNIPSQLNNVVAVAVGNQHTLALRADGTVVAWGLNDVGQCTVPENLSGVIAIAAGDFHSLALKKDGTVVSWGALKKGTTYVDPVDYLGPNLANIQAIDAGYQHLLFLRHDGKVIAGGDNTWGQANVPNSLSNVIQLVGGGIHSLALKNDGTVVGWGANYFGQAAPPTGLSSVALLSAGGHHSLAIKSDGSIVGWGRNLENQLAIPSGILAHGVYAGYQHSIALISVVNVQAIDRDASEGPTPNPGTFVVARTGSLSQSLTVNLQISGTASSGSDYTPISASVTIPANQTSAIITLNPVNDSVSELPETVTLSVVTGSNYAVGPLAQDTIIISDDDTPVTVVTIEAVDATASENISPIDQAAVIVVRQGSLSNAVTVGLQTSGTATSGADYIALPASVTLPSGQSSVSLSISPLNDDVAEDVESVIVSVLPGSGYNLGSAVSASVAIYDDDKPLVTIEAIDPYASEGPPIDVGRLWVRRHTIQSQPLTVHFMVNGTAKANQDYLSLGNSVTIPGGQPGVELTVIPINDEELETAETVAVTLTAASAYRLDNKRTALVLIVSDPGKVIAWGSNSFNQRTVPSSLNQDVAIISAGVYHSLALKTDGTVVAWGRNTWGQCNVPSGLRSVVAIAASYFHSVALKADGTVVAWGDNTHGQCNVPPGLSDVIAITVGWEHTVALKADGTLVAWGLNHANQCNIPVGLNQVRMIAGGDDHTLALKADGTVIGWGTNAQGQLTIPPSLGSIQAVAAGEYHSVALKSDGTVVAWGGNSMGQTNIPGGLTNVIAITANRSHTLALKSDRSIVGWGDNSAGQINIPAGLQALQISAGGFHSLALQPHTAVQIFTDDAFAVESSPSDYARVIVSRSGPTTNPLTVSLTISGTALPGVDYVAIGNTVTLPAGADHVVLAITPIPDGWLEPDESVVVQVASSASYIIAGTGSVQVMILQRELGSLIAWGDNLHHQCDTPLFTDVVGIAAGGYHSLALRADGSVIGWGGQWVGQSKIPAGLSNVVQIAAGDVHSLALCSDGKVVAWGHHGDGQCTPPSSLRNAVAVSAGGWHSLALQADGTVVGWGYNHYGQCNPPSGLRNVIAIAAGRFFSLALKADGTVVGWGGGSAASVPSGLSNVVAIAAGGTHALALTSGGTVVAWGGNDSGQTTVPAGLSNVVRIAAGAEHSLALKADGTVVAWGSNSAGQSLVPAGLLASAIAGGVPEFSDGFSLAIRRETRITIQATDADAAEGTPANTGTFTITRTGDTTSALTVNFTVSGTASAGSDYTALGTSVTIPAGQTSVTLTVTPIDDTAVEGAETVIVTLAAG
ncbi:MAG: Calx-beta domain-containing protein, partial [Planctomycetota bacterium]|nr:Calx-beta domain-containing protein [Planctomycetota bacterium]